MNNYTPQEKKFRFWRALDWLLCCKVRWVCNKHDRAVWKLFH